jgi:hypothetical protein
MRCVLAALLARDPRKLNLKIVEKIFNCCIKNEQLPASQLALVLEIIGQSV